MMNAIYIPQLTTAPDQTARVDINDYLADLETLTPVQGFVQVRHRGNYLEVVGQAEAIITLTCDRCLQQFNHRLQIDTSELIWLEDPADVVDDELQEREVALDELVESLSPTGYFHPDVWLYEQMCLEIPMRKLCDAQCEGIELGDHLPASPPASQPPIDRRWASLEALKHHLS